MNGASGAESHRIGIQRGMLTALIFNPGSNSLKFEVIQCEAGQHVASEAKKLASAALDGIGKQPKLLFYNGREVISEENSEARDMREAVSAALAWLRKGKLLERLAFIGIRVVHGGPKHAVATRATPEVRSEIEVLEDLAPLHNQSSLDVLAVMDKELPGVPVFVAFDTAFHRSLPEKAWRYPIERKTADRHGVRKFGFHGLSHRYMLEQYAVTVGKKPGKIDLVTLHLESGSSACAIQRGQSVDTTMGLTPLEGLMMGSRSGSIDPAIVPFLMRRETRAPTIS
jgi:acetate kinase